MKVAYLIFSLVLLQSTFAYFPVIPPEEIPYLQNIPGFEFIGAGYDSRFVLFREGVRLPFINFTFNSSTYFHPLLTSRVYRLPEEVIPRTISYSEATALIYEKVSEFKERMAWEFGIQVEQNDSSIISKVVEICNKVKDGTCDDGISNLRQLSISPKITFVKDFLESQDFYAIESREFTQLYALHLFPENITNGAQADLNKLKGKVFEDNVDDFMQFIEKYGTHYVNYAVLGGEVSMIRCVKKQYTKTVENLTITVNLTAGEALAEANMDFKTQLNPNLGVGFESTKQESQLDSTTSWTLTGGDSGKANLLDSSVTREAVKNWKDSIPTNPAPIRYHLKKISSFVKDPQIKAELELAIAVYLSLETVDINLIQPRFK